MKVYILKKQRNFGDFECPIEFDSTPWVFRKKKDAEKKAKELDKNCPHCNKDEHWKLSTWVDKVELL
jgi:hypothetical protein